MIWLPAVGEIYAGRRPLFSLWPLCCPRSDLPRRHHPIAPQAACRRGVPRRPGRLARLPARTRDRSLAPMDGASESLSPALERVLAKFSGTLRSVCWRYHFTGADVDELLQEVRIRLWRAHGEVPGASEHIASISASYLHRTALSAAIDLMRRRRARGGDRTFALEDDDEGLPAESSPERELEQSELAAQVERAIERIHPSRRPVIRMHLLGHSREEIARLLGWTDAKTRNLLYRGLADLRERLLAEGVQWTSRT